MELFQLGPIAELTEAGFVGEPGSGVTQVKVGPVGMTGEVELEILPSVVTGLYDDKERGEVGMPELVSPVAVTLLDP